MIVAYMSESVIYLNLNFKQLQIYVLYYKLFHPHKSKILNLMENRNTIFHKPRAFLRKNAKATLL
jgi:hypothetical protein